MLFDPEVSDVSQGETQMSAKGNLRIQAGNDPGSSIRNHVVGFGATARGLVDNESHVDVCNVGAGRKLSFGFEKLVSPGKSRRDRDSYYSEDMWHSL